MRKIAELHERRGLESRIAIVKDLSDPTTIGAAILRHAESHPDSTAVVATGLEPLSYRHLRDHLVRPAARLRESGFDRNDRIAVALPSSADGALAIVATACASVVMPIDTQLTAPEIYGGLASLRPRAVIVRADGPSAAREAAVGRGVAVVKAVRGGPDKPGLNLSAPEVGPAAAAGEPDAAATAFILQTPGATASPKLNMLAAAARAQSWFGLVPADRCLSVSPIGYLHGLKVTLFTPLLTGGSVAFPLSLSSLDVSEWLGTLRPTLYSAGPTLHRFMLDKTKPPSNMRSIHSLRFVVSGGAPLAREVREGLSVSLGVPVLEHYGSSEAAQISANLPPPGPFKSGTRGIPAKAQSRVWRRTAARFRWANPARSSWEARP